MMALDNAVLEELNDKQLLGMLANRQREEEKAKGWVLRRAMADERKQIEEVLAKRRKK